MGIATIAGQQQNGVFTDPRVAARERAGLSLDAAATQARITPQYLRAIEKRGGCSFGLAARLANLYGNGCRIDLFLRTQTSTTTNTTTKGKSR